MRNRPPSRAHSALSWSEAWAYISLWTGVVVYMCYDTYWVSQEAEHKLNPYSFVEGWSIIGRRKDASNFEWETWVHGFLSLLPWIIGHLVMGHLLNKTGKLWQYKGHILLVYDTAVSVMNYGLWPALVHVMFCMVSYSAAAVSESVLCCWAVSIGLLTTLNFEPFISWMKYVCGGQREDPYEERFNLLIFTLAWTHLRCTSFMIEYCWIAQNYRVRVTKLSTASQHQGNYFIGETAAYQSQGEKSTNSNKAMQRQSPTGSSSTKSVKAHMEEKAKQVNCDTKTKVRGECTDSAGVNGISNHQETESIPSFIDLLTYIMYLPFQTFGPVLCYNKFRKQWLARVPQLPYRSIFLEVLRVCFWWLFLEVSLHFMYFNAIHNEKHMLKRVPLWTLAGIGYLMGQMFMVKYVVMYGLPRALGLFDGVDAPKGPICISRVNLYSRMWKEFDRGLYEYIKRYIYIPLGGSRTSITRQCLASVSCFAFVFYWHGAEMFILVWVFFNLIGITMETVMSHIASHPRVQEFENKLLSPAMSRRLRAALCCPATAMSAVAIFCFFGGHEKGLLFHKRIIVDGWPVATLTLFFFLYCFSQTCFEIDRWEAKRKEKRP